MGEVGYRFLVYAENFGCGRSYLQQFLILISLLTKKMEWWVADDYLNLVLDRGSMGMGGGIDGVVGKKIISIRFWCFGFSKFKRENVFWSKCPYFIWSKLKKISFLRSIDGLTDCFRPFGLHLRVFWKFRTFGGTNEMFGSNLLINEKFGTMAAIFPKIFWNLIHLSTLKKTYLRWI